MKKQALLIAGTQSGSGKTTITLGIMAALKQLGYSLAPFKCGPDFIDPSLHKLVTKKVSRNLDLWMAGEPFSKDTFYKHAMTAEISVVEGVMGMFDGGASSSAALAKELGIPLILVLDVRSAAESGAAVLKGFETLDPAIAPVGVILNMTGSTRHFELVRDAITKHCRAEILGHLPRTLDFTLPSRHLGLHMGEESPVTEEKIEALARTMIEHIDMQRLLEIATVDLPPAAERAPLPTDTSSSPTIRLAVARDKAFCFYYQDNFDILARAGADICFFSPLEDSRLPEDIDAVYLGGGYPELYGAELSRNTGLLGQIQRWAEDGRPLYAECGGFMYLTQGITDLDGTFHTLASVFPTTAAMQTKRSSLGYREITTTASSFFGPPETVLRGHEFHYSTVAPLPESVERIYSVNNGSTEGYRRNNVLGGYMHLHFGSSMDAAHTFVEFCRQHRHQRYSAL